MQYPVLIGLFITLIPFYIAIYQALKLLNLIDHNQAFSELSVQALHLIRYCAVSISLVYVLGMLFLIWENALHPGIALIGLIIVFASFVIAVFSSVLQALLKQALDIKAENELTV